MPVRGDVGEARGAVMVMGGGRGVLPLPVRRVGARRVHVTADVCVEWPKGRGGVPLAERRGMSGSGRGGQRCRCRRRCRVGALLGGAWCVAAGVPWGG